MADRQVVPAWWLVADRQIVPAWRFTNLRVGWRLASKGETTRPGYVSISGPAYVFVLPSAPPKEPTDAR